MNIKLNLSHRLLSALLSLAIMAGLLGWAKNGESSGTAGLSKRLEAIRVVAVTKGGKAPGKTSGAFVRK